MLRAALPVGSLEGMKKRCDPGRLKRGRPQDISIAFKCLPFHLREARGPIGRSDGFHLRLSVGAIDLLDARSYYDAQHECA